ncbi:MAG: hypothetical protein A2341_19795 [Deltaproteobacteria bacterium RIFOXYB12_FULL_58_9]|nr:MAG: hypothetical protein A2341_19795 [Deltaproteobacteria bacterium RIFOXYB12_FULL_58_9]
MFAGQCKMIGKQTVHDLVGNQPALDIDAPLMEAVHLMVENNLINLPILDKGELVGMLRDNDLLAAASAYFS